MLSIRANLISAFGIVLLSILAVPQAANAEPVRITTGFVSVTSNIRDTLFFNFSGNGLSANGLDPHASVAQIHVTVSLVPIALPTWEPYFSEFADPT